MTRTAMRKGDKFVVIAIITMCLLLGGFFLWRLNHKPSGSYVTVIKAHTGEEFEYSLRRDRKIEVQGYLGTSVIEVANGKVRFASSPCPDKVCVNVFGWIEKESELSLCLPNQILLEIREQ